MTGVTEGPVRLSPHPLQRAGAFALARLAGVAHPSAITEAQLAVTVALMTGHAVEAARVRSASKDPDPGAYWWKMLYACYPNAPETHGQRHKPRRDGGVKPLEQRVREGRALPDEPLDPLVPCVFCAAPAVRHVGKVEFPLLASVEHRNVTAPGVPGFPLCRGCLASGWAIPYASRHYGRLAVFDSSDEQIAAEFAAEAVDANRQMIEVQAKEPPAREKRGAEEVAVTLLRRHGSRARAGPRPTDFVSLVLFRNGNQEPELTLRFMNGRRCDFVCSLGGPGQAVSQGWEAARRLLTVVDRNGGVTRHGLTVLARALFHESDAKLLRLLTAAARWSVRSGAPGTLDDLAIHYLRKVSTVQDHEIARITAVAERVAGLLATESAKGAFHEFAQAQGPADLRRWFRKRSVHWLLFGGQDEPLLSPEEFLTLFPEGGGWWQRDLLFVAVVADLHARGWRPDGADLEALEVTDDEHASEQEVYA